MKSKAGFEMSGKGPSVGLARQRGMGATIILFTIALIALVGAALAYASRGNPSAMDTQGAKVYAGVLLKQSADYRDAYSRYVFDGKDVNNMKFNEPTSGALVDGDLFFGGTHYGNYQNPPDQALTATQPWLYSKSIVVTDVGSAAPESIVFVENVKDPVCKEINKQLYGSDQIPTIASVSKTTLQDGSTPITVGPGRASGCFVSSGNNFFFATLGEG